MNKYLITAILFSCFISLYAQQITQYRKDTILQYKFTLDSNRLHGPVLVMHNNGQKLIEGTYNRGIKTGDWKVWSTTGELMEHRFYNSYNSYNIVLEKNLNSEISIKDSLVKFTPTINLKEIQRNKRQNPVLYSKRLRVFVSRDSLLNAPIFSTQILYRAILTCIYDSSRAINPSSRSYAKLNPKKLAGQYGDKLTNPNSEAIIGFYFDIRQFIRPSTGELEFLISAIAPVLRSGDPFANYLHEPFWINFEFVEEQLRLSEEGKQLLDVLKSRKYNYISAYYVTSIDDYKSLNQHLFETHLGVLINYYRFKYNKELKGRFIMF